MLLETRYNNHQHMMAANQIRSEVFPLAALCLAGTRVRGFNFENRTFIGGASWLSSTTQQGYGYRCDETASGSPVGRFTSPDEPFADQHERDPQSWNMYAYVRNNPLRFVDADGRECGSNGIDDKTHDACFTVTGHASQLGRLLGRVRDFLSGPTGVDLQPVPPTPFNLRVQEMLSGPPGMTLAMIPFVPEGGLANASRLRAQLAFEEAGILTQEGAGLTEAAIARAREIQISGGRLTNPQVVRELTKDGSSIGDWGKFTTESVDLGSGQRSQVHFYKNRVTGAVNLNIDFKVKGTVK